MTNYTNKKNSNTKQFFIDWIVPILITFIIAIFIHTFVGFIVKIPSSSMVPTLNIGDKALSYRIYNTENLSRGDLIVFYYEPEDRLFIKRLIGLPYDQITINNGIVSINGVVITEDYIEDNLIFNGEFQVPSDSYFFLGDNRSNSFDSRFWENPFINSKDIKSKAFMKIYPFQEIKFF